MKYLFFLLCFGFSVLAIGQTDFRKGKIITLQGDTIFGELDWQGDIPNTRAVRFRKMRMRFLSHLRLQAIGLMMAVFLCRKLR